MKPYLRSGSRMDEYIECMQMHLGLSILKIKTKDYQGSASLPVLSVEPAVLSSAAYWSVPYDWTVPHQRNKTATAAQYCVYTMRRLNGP